MFTGSEVRTGERTDRGTDQSQPHLCLDRIVIGIAVTGIAVTGIALATSTQHRLSAEGDSGAVDLDIAACAVHYADGPSRALDGCVVWSEHLVQPTAGVGRGASRRRRSKH